MTSVEPGQDFRLAERLTARSPGGLFTEADLDARPTGRGYRYELVDGALLVSPGAGLTHQRMLVRLLRQLDARCPAGLEILLAPYDVQLTPDRIFEPDLLVARSADLQERAIVRPPLVVEVLSSSSRLIDEGFKRAAYEEACIPSHWLVDPVEPAIRVLELDETGRYGERGQARGDAPLAVTRPCPVTVRLR